MPDCPHDWTEWQRDVETWCDHIGAPTYDRDLPTCSRWCLLCEAVEVEDDAERDDE